MRTFMLLMVPVILTGCASGPIDVQFEPHHRTAYLDHSLRILEVTVPPGTATLDHTHSHDMANVCIGCPLTRTRAPGEDWGEVRPRQTGNAAIAEYSGKPGTHAVLNVGEGPYRLIAVENLRAAGWSENRPLDGPATANVRQETRSFRVYDVELAAGEGPLGHAHTAPTLIVLVEGKVRVGSSGADYGKQLEVAGEWRLTPAGETHVLGAPAGVTARLVEIEIR